LQPFLLSKTARNSKALVWLSRSIRQHKGVPFYFKVIIELYDLSFLNKSIALKNKARHYLCLFLYKTSKNFL
jgi:hypothetical protein